MKDGYYWVRDNDGIIGIAERDGDRWYWCGLDQEFQEKDFLEIGDYIETPDKYKE